MFAIKVELRSIYGYNYTILISKKYFQLSMKIQRAINGLIKKIYILKLEYFSQIYHKSLISQTYIHVLCTLMDEWIYYNGNCDYMGNKTQ